MPLLSASDLFLMPSVQESFGLAALEAMACEVPVVASRIGGLPDLIEDGVTGFLCAAGRSRGYGSGRHPPLDRQAASPIGWPGPPATRRRQRFADTKIVPMYEAYYDEILGDGQGRRGWWTGG